MNEKYQNDLLVLALATGFRGFVKDGKTWIMTLHKGQSLPFRINFEREDIKMGMFNLVFIFFQATKQLSLKFFIPLSYTLKDFFKSLFFIENNVEIKGWLK